MAPAIPAAPPVSAAARMAMAMMRPPARDPPGRAGAGADGKGANGPATGPPGGPAGPGRGGRKSGPRGSPSPIRTSPRVAQGSLCPILDGPVLPPSSAILSLIEIAAWGLRFSGRRGNAAPSLLLR
ncbi:hypothetical protein GCM10009780_35360 [Actinomadura alba]